MTVVFNAPRMEQETGFRLAPPFCRPPNCAFRDAGDFSSLLWVPCPDMFSHRFESNRLLIDEVVVEPVIFDHQMQNSIEESNVSSRFDRQEQVTSASNRCNARIDDDDFRAVLSRLPHIVRGYRCALTHVRAANPDDFGLEYVRPGIGGAVDAEGLFIRGGGADHAKSSVVINIRRL